MKFGIFCEDQLPRPWRENDEYDLMQNSLDQQELADVSNQDQSDPRATIRDDPSPTRA